LSSLCIRLVAPTERESLRDRAPTAVLTPGIFATSLIVTDGKVMSVTGTKKWPRWGIYW
jgi:hypothetical protein